VAFIGVIADGGMEPILTTAKAARSTLKLLFHDLSTLYTKYTVKCLVVMSKTFRYHVGNESKTFWYLSQICFIDNRLFRFGPESALLDQIEVISFDKTNSGTNSKVLVSFLYSPPSGFLLSYRF
jgi:hypothetical protein